MRLLGLVVGIGLIAGCDVLPEAFAEPPPSTVTPTPQVVIVAGASRSAPATPTTGEREPPTPTFSLSFNGIFTPTPTLAIDPRLLTTTPGEPPTDLKSTRTPVPTRTPFPTSTTIPTRTSLPASAPRDPPPPRNTPTETVTSTPSFTATETPAPSGPGEPNDTAANAQALDIGEDAGLEGILDTPKDIDIFRLDIPENCQDEIAVVTFDAEDPDSYRLVLRTPRRFGIGIGKTLGRTTRQSRIPIQDDTGAWYVEVSALPGKRVLVSEYQISVRIVNTAGQPSEVC